MTQYFISALIFLIPTIGMVAGLSTATTITIFLIVLLNSLWNKLSDYFTCKSIKINLLLNWKLEALLFSWCFLSCLWSINLISSVFMYLQVFSTILIGFIINNNIDKLDIIKIENLIRIERSFIIGISSAIILFFIEYFFQGILFHIFRAIFQPHSKHNYDLYMLDRGCALLSIISWVMIGILIRYNKYLLALLFYILVLYVLRISDSLASFLGFIIGGLIFIVSRLFTTKLLQSIFIKLITITIISGSLLMPIIAYNINPHDLSDKYEKYLPDSSKHRIFIWHFVATKIIKQPIFGYGFGASKYVTIEDDEIIKYKTYRWSPLPLHPHNNIMQIMFETGVIGVILFLSLTYKYLKKIDNIVLKSKNSSCKSLSYACFINYYIIGMISFSIWQLWWVCVGIFVVTIMKLLVYSRSKEYTQYVRAPLKMKFNS